MSMPEIVSAEQWEQARGTWLTYSGGVEFDQTRACTDAAFDAGINFFDTANVYGRGAAESAWGEILSARPRDSYILATKVWGTMSDEPGDSGLSGAQIAKQIDASLARLQTDYVDLYQAHRFDTGVPIEETLEALKRSSTPARPATSASASGRRSRSPPGIEIGGADLFVSSQPQYSMLWQAPEVEVFPLCFANGISQIVWSPLAQGLLTGKYRPGQPHPADSRAANDAMNASMALVMSDERLEAVERLRPVAEQAGLTLVELALAWVLRREELASAIIGASRPEQVHANVKASGIELSPDTLEAIDEALGDAPITQPTLAPFAETGVRTRARP